ncbi:MAG: PEGA domain-containing protein [Polyangiaceae bacterium]|nr:PEGA domain-containing protein [Polyangiaceae bacterium]
MLSSVPLSAQPASTTLKPAQGNEVSSAITDKARELFLEGQKEGAKKRWHAAYANFLAAWSLKQHYQIAGTLGWVEAELGRYREAATHLTYYLREAPKEKVAERKSAEVLLAQARAKVGALALKVEPAGAEVFVDGVSVGKAPFQSDVFVEPGAHVIEAKLDGYMTAKATAEMGAGSSHEVPLKLVKLETGAETARSTAQGAAANAAEGTERAEGEGGPRKEVIIGGIAGSAAFIATGIVFAAVSNGHATDAEEHAKKLSQTPGAPCLSASPGPECEETKSSLTKGRTFGNLSVWSFVVGGALGAGTAIYALAFPTSKQQGRVHVVPVAGSSTGAIVVTGRW